MILRNGENICSVGPDRSMSSFNKRRSRRETCPTSPRIGIHYLRLWCLLDPFSARSFSVHGTSAAAARRWPAAAYTERGRCSPSKKFLPLTLPITRASFCLPLSLFLIRHSSFSRFQIFLSTIVDHNK